MSHLSSFLHPTVPRIVRAQKPAARLILYCLRFTPYSEDIPIVLYEVDKGYETASFVKDILREIETWLNLRR